MNDNKKEENIKRGKRNRQIGYRGETQFRTAFEKNGVGCKRSAHAGLKGDLTILEKDRMEVKRRRVLPDYLWQFSEGVDFLGLVKPRKEKLVVIKWDKFIELYKKANDIE